ncbi:MAG: NlpC/P60 family protein [Planctomycetaceae bacterium]|nr:NlpC/P60 family protein [Planctomycetaceae bacterium]
MSQALKKSIAENAVTWKGVVYQHRGYTRGGCDCTGLLIGILQELGFVRDYQLRKYPMDWNLHAGAGNYIVDELSKFAAPVTLPQPGDIALFRFGRCIAHVGIVLGKGTFIHSHINAGACGISSLYNSPWTKRLAGFYEIREDAL